MKTSIRPIRQDVYAVVLVASDENWQEVRRAFPDLRPGLALGHEFTSRTFGRRRVVIMQTGTGTVSAAACAQHAADRWRPAMLISSVDGDTPEAEAFIWVAERNDVPLAQLHHESEEFSEALAAFLAAAGAKPKQVPPAAEPGPVEELEPEPAPQAETEP